MDISNSRCYSNCSEPKAWENKFLTKVGVWWRNYRTRRHLEDLSTHLLEDIGLTEEQAQQESVRHFWD
tara:strand:- start:12022 stop:12225 length:204 start_codon:yes stop_codon:yes gene_type:complete